MTRAHLKIMFEGFFQHFGFGRGAFRSPYPEGICARKATKGKGERRRKSAEDNFEMGSKAKILAVGFAFLLIAVFPSEGCQKDDTVYDCYFYTINDTTDVQLSLYIDDEFKGELPQLASHPLCGDSVLVGTLHLQLTGGKYDMIAKDQTCEKRSINTVKFNDKVFDTFSKVGFLYPESVGTCVVLGLYF